MGKLTVVKRENIGINKHCPKCNRNVEIQKIYVIEKGVRKKIEEVIRDRRGTVTGTAQREIEVDEEGYFLECPKCKSKLEKHQVYKSAEIVRNVSLVLAILFALSLAYFITADERAKYSSDGKKYTVKESCNMRADSTTDSEIVGQVKSGETVIVIQEKKNWKNIRLESGSIGWIGCK